MTQSLWTSVPQMYTQALSDLCLHTHSLCLDTVHSHPHTPSRNSTSCVTSLLGPHLLQQTSESECAASLPNPELTGQVSALLELQEEGHRPLLFVAVSLGSLLELYTVWAQ